MSELIAAISNVKGHSAMAEACDETTILLLDNLRAKERRGKFAKSVSASWPILAGVFLALCAPMLSDILVPIKPWGMWLVFPFVELMARPELHMGSQFQQYAPQVMLFLQFPLEGLMAKKFLRGQVTVSGVATQVLFYHFLGAVQLWLVWRALGDGGMLR